MGPEITVAGWLAAPLISRLTKLAIDHYLRTSVKQKLKKLQIDLNKVRTIAELENMQFESQSLRDWLWRFKEAVYVAEDVIDSLELQLSWNKDQASSPASSCLMPKVVRKVIQKALLFTDATDEPDNFMRAILFPARRKIDRGDIKQLGEVVKTLGDLIHEIGDILKVVERHEASGGVKRGWIPPFWAGMSHPTGAIPIRGRTAEEEAMLQALLETTMVHGESFLNCSKFSVLSIVGPGGIGKTVLAQLAFHNKVVERHFDIMAWVCVSTQFDLKKLTIKIIESASMERPYDLHNIISLGELRKILTAGMKGKRFLIVLDDVWEESTTAWRYLLTPLNCGKEGSKIVVTTRLEGIARMLETKVTIKLDGLEEEEYLELLKDSAFGVERTNKQPDREQMCCKIAQQLGGLPLAAVRISGFLKDRFERGKTSLVARDGDLLSVLGQSYQQLPEHLKQCYISCALFPKNYCFEKNQLLRFWMALGLTPSNGASYAHNFVDDLSSRSFFVDAWRKKNKFVIHAMMHELADHICDGEFFRLEDGIEEIEIPMKAHHLYVTADNFVRFSKVLRKRKFLRSLVIDGRLSSPISHSEFMDSLAEVLKDSRRLRLLMLSELPGDLPDAIVHLRHLRYLEFPDSGVDKLPKSFCRFYHRWRLNLKTGSKHLLLRNHMDQVINLCALDPNLEAIDHNDDI
ncbi:putative disease resistance RPP13-like protein 1 [Curcuma longa]|uniref:putative disease resistance RPP13-like protein 1 n=1 Tax=Curcuma longa TaxID=136217 RepID=UPI003D9DF507